MLQQTMKRPVQPTGLRSDWQLWRAWIAANALAELIGLGASSLLWILFMVSIESYIGLLFSAFILVVGSTLLEGSAVGIAQWLVLRQRLRTLRLRDWWLATAVGAFVAWSLGMIPSIMMALTVEPTDALSPAAMSDTLMYTLAAGMGLLLGPVLGLPQWWVLRRQVAPAWPWIGANAVAWALGMPIIFITVSLIPSPVVTIWTVLIVLGGLTVAGAVVGAVHGIVLVRLLANQSNL
jgi:hypothetical protein